MAIGNEGEASNGRNENGGQGAASANWRSERSASIYGVDQAAGVGTGSGTPVNGARPRVAMSGVVRNVEEWMRGLGATNSRRVEGGVRPNFASNRYESSVRERGAGESGAGTETTRDELVFELREQNRRMAETNRLVMEQLAMQQRVAQRQQVEQQNEFTRTLEAVVNRVMPAAGGNRLGGMEAGGRRLQTEALAQITEFWGGLDEAVEEWIETMEGVAEAYEWTGPQHRQAAVSKMRGSARDWHMIEGVEREEWVEWKRGLITAFGTVLTIDQWMAQVKKRTRKPDENIRAYCYSKWRLCRRCPVDIGEREIVRYLTQGIRNQQVEAMILAARPHTLDDFFVAIREWEEFMQGREGTGERVGTERRSQVKTDERGEVDGTSPLLSQIAKLTEEVGKLHAKWEKAESEARRPSAPRALSPGPTVRFQMGTGVQEQTRRFQSGSCFNCGKLGHISAFCPDKTQTEQSGAAAANGAGNV